MVVFNIVAYHLFNSDAAYIPSESLHLLRTKHALVDNRDIFCLKLRLKMIIFYPFCPFQFMVLKI